MRGLDRVLSLALAGALALAPTSVLAEPASAEPAPSVDDALAEAKAWHVDADAKYNTADYEGAIEAWQKAYAALPRTAEANPYRSLILYNIAAAREKLFSLRGDVEHLKQAKILLEQFEASIDETYAGAPEEGDKERAQVQEKLARIDGLIAAANRDDAPAKRPATAPAEPGPRKTTTTDAPPRAREPGRGLLIGGGVLLGLGVVAGAGMTAALVEGGRANDLDEIADDNLDAREDLFDRGRRANVGAIVAGAIGAACLAAGTALVVIGAKRRSSRTALTPAVGRGFAGLTLVGRF